MTEEDIELIPTFYDKDGDPMFTVKDLAKQLNVSVKEMTRAVEKVLSDKEKLCD